MRDLAFMGRIVASSTHDMQNIMAIIKESACLVHDILKMNGLPKMKHGEKIPYSLQVIDAQVLRGRELLQALNSFAHATFDGESTTDLPLITAQAAKLAARMVRLKDCTMEFVPYATPLSIAGTPFYVIETIFAATAHVLSCCTAKDHIALHIEKQQDKSGASITIKGGNSPLPPLEEDLKTLVAQCCHTVTLTDNAISLYFSLAKEV